MSIMAADEAEILASLGAAVHAINADAAAIDG
jgi:hypothetical protein